MSKILARAEIRPHKIQYYLERRDEEFERKMAEALCVYKEVELLRKAGEDGLVAGLSYDEQPGIQAIGVTAPDLRRDPLLALCAGKNEPFGMDAGAAALAAPSTLNRMELSNERETRAHKIAHDSQSKGKRVC